MIILTSTIPTSVDCLKSYYFSYTSTKRILIYLEEDKRDYNLFYLPEYYSKFQSYSIIYDNPLFVHYTKLDAKNSILATKVSKSELLKLKLKYDNVIQHREHK